MAREIKKRLGKSRKIREFENKWLWQVDENYFFFKRGKVVLSHEIV